ncbi:unnamed protein product [Pieris macdunnoughi]|uniref:Uncharacterized protein n=1 Tax=Pieris macdunnoughi TaxID=345717 RepID=A0A821LPI4_9NEOP|nr:unnamed protein product [Pieris macdunnoughi]
MAFSLEPRTSPHSRFSGSLCLILQMYSARFDWAGHAFLASNQVPGWGYNWNLFWMCGLSISLVSIDLPANRGFSAAFPELLVRDHLEPEDTQNTATAVEENLEPETYTN